MELPADFLSLGRGSVNFHVTPRRSQVHQNECWRLLMKIVDQNKIVRLNLDVVKE